MTSDSTVSVAAQWARWGMDPGERGGYHLLACSRWPFGPRNFEEILARFSPGDLDTLPQVTVSYVRAEDGSRYIGMAVHEAETGGSGRVGRDVMVTRYFCFPYTGLAVAAVPYLAIYEAIRGIEALPADGALCSLELPTGLAATDVDLARAAPVAALLLTGNPVCVTGPESGTVTERLAFIDAVMSLLPYGMRAELAAATWTNSVYRGHRFRLFFSGAPRAWRPPAPEDHRVRLGPDDVAITRAADTRVAPGLADSYLGWLPTQPGESLRARLARATDPVPFTGDEIARMLDGVMAPGRGRPRGAADATEQAVRRPWRPDARPLPPEENQDAAGNPAPDNGAAGGKDAGRVEDLLTRCLRAVERRATVRLTAVVSQLEALLRANEPRDQDQDARVQSLVGRASRLARFLEVGKRRTAFYEFLQRAVGTGVIDYQGYCLAEDVIGGRPHEGLLRAIDALAGDDIIVRLIVAHYLDGNYPRLTAREAVELAAGPLELRPAHARIICGAAIQALEVAGPAEVDDARPLLAAHGYLASALARHVPDDLPFQVAALTALLRTAVDGSLAGDALRDILAADRRQAPTSALLLAVLGLSEPGAVDEMLHAFLAGLAGAPDLGDDLRDMLASQRLAVEPRSSRADTFSADPPDDASAGPRSAGPRGSTLFRRLLNPGGDPSRRYDDDLARLDDDEQ